MIAKIKKGKFFKGAIFYNELKVEKGDAMRLGAVGFNSDNPSKEAIIMEFSDMQTMCPIKQPVFHVSLNFAPGESLSDDSLKDIAYEYMTRMGYDNTPYVIYKHMDVAHQHIHIVSANITLNENGKYRGIDVFRDHIRSEKISRDMELKYNLVVATEEERRKTKVQTFIQGEPEVCTYGEEPTFDYLKRTVDFVLSERLFSNLSKLNMQLNKYNIRCYANTSRTGEKYYKFTCIDATGKSVGVGGTARQLRLTCGRDEIERLFQENSAKYDSFHSVMKGLLKKYITMSEFDLKEALRVNSCESDYNMIRNFIPKNFVDCITVKREYFPAFLRTVTAFRKQNRIYHESSLIKNPFKLLELENYVLSNLTSLRKQQVEILYRYYREYKLKFLPAIEEKEKNKDISWVNKVITFLNSLDLGYMDKILLMEKLGICIRDKNVEIYNNVDQVVHVISRDDILKVNGNSRERVKYRNEIKDLAEKDLNILKKCINGKISKIDIKYLLAKTKVMKQQGANQTNLFAGLIPRLSDLRQRGLLKWDDEEEDDVEKEEEEIQVRKHRNRPR